MESGMGEMACSVRMQHIMCMYAQLADRSYGGLAASTLSTYLLHAYLHTKDRAEVGQY
jgi:hypothetical protein